MSCEVIEDTEGMVRIVIHEVVDYDEDGVPVYALADPTSVTVKFRSPSGVVTSVSAAMEETGIWLAPAPSDEDGMWRYTVTTTGTIVVSRNGRYQVKALAVP